MASPLNDIPGHRRYGQAPKIDIQFSLQKRNLVISFNRTPIPSHPLSGFICSPLSVGVFETRWWQYRQGRSRVSWLYPACVSTEMKRIISIPGDQTCRIKTSKLQIPFSGDVVQVDPAKDERRKAFCQRSVIFERISRPSVTWRYLSYG